MQDSIITPDPLWFKNAIIYEVPVRAFADSNGDGIGDFRGLTEKLDYLQDLGVTAVWLLPFFPSPLRDDGYDISDYTSVNPIYGTLDDFKDFLEAAHRRGIRVIIELIINHTSDQHPWFQRARRAPKDSPERDFYVWSDTLEKYRDARIIFQDFETSNWAWDAIAKSYYWHRFYSHQPDLNYDNPLVRQAVFEVLDFWLSMGVDGLRMDAVPYLYEREGTNCENLPETHEFLKQLRQRVDEKYPDRMLLAEANQWPEDAAQYYGIGDECHMNFHFPLMPRLFMSLRMEDSFPIQDILQQTPTIPDNCQWALFLRNHDELTLEMVTDEDRDYMYRVYAQDPEMRVNLGIRRRLAPLLGNDRRQIELLNSLLLALPGTPVLYYGDEIGMGDNVYVGDRNGVRTPMQWSSDRNAGFSRANPQRLYLPVIVESEYHYEAVNVEAQRANVNSLWNWMKRLLATRKQLQALGRGSFELLHSENRKVLAFTRTYDDEHVLVVVNLSRFVQTVELDLSAFKDMEPIEIFGRTKFPAITEHPYFLSVGPYGFYWFALKLQPSLLRSAKSKAELPSLTVRDRWSEVLSPTAAPRAFATLQDVVLPHYLYTCSWFASKARTIRSVQIAEILPASYKDLEVHIAGLQVEYTQGSSETYILPLAYAAGEEATHLLADTPQDVIAHLQVQHHNKAGVLFDATADKRFLAGLMDVVRGDRTYQSTIGELVGTLSSDVLADDNTPFKSPMLLKGALRNTSVIYDETLRLKLFRRVEEGINPDLEIRRFLAKQHHTEHIVPVIGELEYRRPGATPVTVGILQNYIHDARNSWDYTLDSLRDYFDSVATQYSTMTAVPLPSGSLIDVQNLLSEVEPKLQRDTDATDSSSSHLRVSTSPDASLAPIPTSSKELAFHLMGSYLANVQRLGQTTAELHIALASNTDDSAFAPELFSSFYQRSIYQYARTRTGQVFLLLKQRLKSLSPEAQELARRVLTYQDRILEQFQRVLTQKVTAMRTRYHGHFHLGQVLYTGKDFIVLDFEGEPGHTLSERRIKRSPLRDVAGMLQSFSNAAHVALHREVEGGMIRPDNRPIMEQWAQFWHSWVSAAFLHSYLQVPGQEKVLPNTPQELQLLLDAFVLEKVVDELGLALNHQPAWAEVPLQRLLTLVKTV
jgi:maltose alpha-D-glucosyltransferase / alpha-amylase